MKIKKREKRGPFTIIGTREVYKNPWIRVREDKVIRPDGKRGIFGIVEAQPGISIVPIDKNGYVYLTKEYHYGVGETTIEEISGGIDTGEGILQAAKRELMEETGLISHRWYHLGNFYPFTTILYSPQYVLLALDVKKATSPVEEDKKLIKIIRVSFQKALKMVLTGKINHAGSAIAILKAEHFLRKKHLKF